MYKVTTYYDIQPDKIYRYKALSIRYWYDHVIYTRNAIISLMANGDDINDVATRLIKNQDDIGKLFRDFYPSDKVDNLVFLLKEHIEQASAIIKAIMEDQDISDLVTQWENNCQMILDQLIEFNPYLKQSNLSTLWNEHLALTINEIKFRQNKNWSSDMLNFDKILDNISEISTILANGVVDQFPLYFCTPVKKGEENA